MQLVASAVPPKRLPDPLSPPRTTDLVLYGQVILDQLHEPKARLAALCRARTRTVALSWCFCARYAALRYSLIKPWTICLRLIRAVTSTTWPGSYSGGRVPLENRILALA